LFKQASVTDELMSGMETQLVKNAIGESAKARLSKAVDLLDAAARIFEDAGMPEYSDQVVSILSEVAGKLVVPSENEWNADDKGE
jgi:hypothetical protein